MTEINKEAQKAIDQAVDKRISETEQHIIEGVKAATPQPAAPAQQPDGKSDDAEKLKTELDETKSKLQSWEKGEQFLAFDPALHATHPDSKPKVDEYVQGALQSLSNDELKTEVTRRGFLPPVKEITLPDGTKIKPKK